MGRDRGVYEEHPQPSGAVVRVLVEPSAEYLAEREQRAQAEAAREAERADRERAKRDAVRNARSVAELRDALVTLLGIDDG